MVELSGPAQVGIFWERFIVSYFEADYLYVQFCPTVSSENDFMKRFAKIGIGSGKNIDASKLSPEIKKASSKEWLMLGQIWRT
jgi:hypothetical protein